MKVDIFINKNFRLTTNPFYIILLKLFLVLFMFFNVFWRYFEDSTSKYFQRTTYENICKQICYMHFNENHEKSIKICNIVLICRNSQNDGHFAPILFELAALDQRLQFNEILAIRSTNFKPRDPQSGSRTIIDSAVNMHHPIWGQWIFKTYRPGAFEKSQASIMNTKSIWIRQKNINCLPLVKIWHFWLNSP